jgi:hypothetical protein
MAQRTGPTSRITEPLRQVLGGPAVNRHDDPLADLALARLLRLRLRLHAAEEVPLPPHTVVGDLRVRASELTARALTMMEGWGHARWDLDSDRALAREWAQEQGKLLRPGAEAELTRFDKLTCYRDGRTPASSAEHRSGDS